MNRKESDYLLVKKVNIEKEAIFLKLRENGFRITNQRKLIIDIIFNKECTSCKEIYWEASKKDSSIGIATVYRIIKSLEEIGAINRKNLYKISSEEIDILIELKKDFDNKKYRNSQQVNESEKYYDDLMNKYLNGDPNTINQMKNIMKNLGLDENSLKDKSPDEINQYIDNLCNSFGISREQVDNLAKKFNFK